MKQWALLKVSLNQIFMIVVKSNTSKSENYCIATKQSERSSIKSRSSSKSKIDLRNETSAEDKFQNVRETKL